MTKKINVIFESADEALTRELWERGRAFVTQTAADQQMAGSLFVKKECADKWPNAQIVCHLSNGKEIVLQ